MEPWPWSVRDHVCFPARHGTADAPRGNNFFCLQAVEGVARAFWPCGLRIAKAGERSRGADYYPGKLHCYHGVMDFFCIHSFLVVSLLP